MGKKLTMLIAFTLLLGAVFGEEKFVFYDGLVNSKARQISHLSGALDKRVTTVEVLNDGDQVATHYLVAIPLKLREQFAYVAGSDDKDVELQVNEVEVVSSDADFQEQITKHTFFKIQFPSPLKPKKSARLKVTIGYIHVLKPLPKEILQHDNQYSLYEGTRYFYTPYVTSRQSIRFVLASDKIKSYSKTGPVSVERSKIKYGPYDRVDPFEVNPCKIHFMNNEPILRATSVVRDYEISHWGNVRVTQNYNMVNSGAKLKGPYEAKSIYQRQYGGKIEPSAVRELKATLPPNAHRVSYTDRIGNISSSHFRLGRKKSTLEIDLRYPLFGGWKTDFEIGYDAPSSDFVLTDPNDPLQFVLNVSFASPFKTPVTDFMTTRVALPEGAYDIVLQLPYEVDSIREDRRFTYLDSSIGGGRPLIVFTKRNVVDLHTRYFQVFYRYNNKTTMIRKPLLLFGTIFLFFTVWMSLSRVELSLERQDAKKRKSKPPSASSPGKDPPKQTNTPPKATPKAGVRKRRGRK